MKGKLIAGLTAGALLLSAAPLAFAQSVVPAVSSSTTGTGSTGAYTTTGSSSTTGTTGTGSTSATPGVPNTGAGGDAATNAIVLTLSGIIALGGIGYLATRRVRA